MIKTQKCKSCARVTKAVIKKFAKPAKKSFKTSPKKWMK